jgi:hypothetical protein
MSRKVINMNATVKWTEANTKESIISIAFKRGDLDSDSPMYIINIKVSEGFNNSIARSLNRIMVARIDKALNHKKTVIETISGGTGWKDEEPV